ncbi:MAG: aminotransferase [Proteobacteria bacterium]|nr:MAG: aminotransferase [Pseudomonadota bacterium]
MRVPFLDVAGINSRFGREFAEAQARVLQSGWFLRGAETRSFESEFGTRTGAPHCVLVANGYDALRLALRAWISLRRLERGDEVIVPANSFIASALAVTDAGLALRLADVEPSTFNVSAASIEAALTPRTRVVMPVHLYGQLADIEAIRALCAKKDLLLFEDAAQAHGAERSGSHAGIFGEAGAFSFYPVKNLGALGDSGCLITKDLALAERVRMFGDYGSTAKYEHAFRGFNSRTDELQAAFLRIKLRHLDRDNDRRRQIALRYREGIAHPLVATPRGPSEPSAHVWHLFVVATPGRGSLTRHLEARGIGTMIHYPKAIHRQAAYAELVGEAPRVPVAERLQHEVLSLPISPVMTDNQVEAVVAAVNSWSAPRQNVSQS